MPFKTREPLPPINQHHEFLWSPILAAPASLHRFAISFGLSPHLAPQNPTLFFSGKNSKSKFFPFHKKIFSLERATHRLHSGLSIGKKIRPVSFLCSPHSRLSFTHFIHFPFTLCPSAIKSHSRFILMPKATHRASALPERVSNIL